MAQNISAISPYGLRMPAPLRRLVKRAAKENGRSMNSEIVVQLGRIYGAAGEAAGQVSEANDPAASGNTGGFAPAGNVNHG